MLTSRVDFAGLFYVLDTSRGIPASLAEAKAKGIPVIAYGQLLMDGVQFVIVAFAVFLVVRQVNTIKARYQKTAVPTTKDCPLCLSVIPIKATRCAHCTSAL